MTSIASSMTGFDVCVFVLTPHNMTCLGNVGNFVNQYQANAQILANSLGNGVTAAEVLAVAGNESTYGTSNKTSFGTSSVFMVMGLQAHTTQ